MALRGWPGRGWDGRVALIGLLSRLLDKVLYLRLFEHSIGFRDWNRNKLKYLPRSRTADHPTNHANILESTNQRVRFS